MAFDYTKLQRAKITNLVRLGCSRKILLHAAARYAIARSQPQEHRKGLGRAHFSEKQIASLIASAEVLANALARIQREPLLVAANSMRQEEVCFWRKELADMTDFLKRLVPFRPDTGAAVSALVMHVKQQTRKRHLPEVLKLLNASLGAADLPANLSATALQKQIQRADHQAARRMLLEWQSSLG